MKKALILAVNIILASTAMPLFAETNYQFLDGLNFRVGLNHIAGYNADMSGDPDRDDYTGTNQNLPFKRTDFAEASVGMEYMFQLGNNFEIGPGIEYNFESTLERKYHNNFLARRSSRQKETNKFINTPLYIACKYNFETTSDLRPYVFLRLGYSFNKLDYSIVNYEMAPDQQPGTGQDVLKKAHVKDKKNSLYSGIGFGITFKNNFFIEALYNYTSFKYKTEYPYSFVDAAVTTHDFVCNEKWDAGIHALHLMVGYKFSSSEVSKAKPVSAEGRRSQLGGLNIRVGINKNLPINSELKHEVSKINTAGEPVFSVQDVAHKPEHSGIVASIGLEYMFPVLNNIEIGPGVEHNYKNTFEKEQSYSNPSLTKIEYIEFSNTALYLACKYNFETSSFARPYVVGRIGYSFNDVDYSKYKGGADLKRGGSKDVEDDFYYGIGFGVKFNRHVFVEAIYAYTKVKFKASYVAPDMQRVMQSQRENFDSDIQTLGLKIGYIF